ncbi:hypothetical protein QTP88_017621 [Uroleucon formosanum]
MKPRFLGRFYCFLFRMGFVKENKYNNDYTVKPKSAFLALLADSIRIKCPQNTTHFANCLHNLMLKTVYYQLPTKVN